MADKQISQLPAATQINDEDVFAMQQGSTAKKVTGEVLNGHIAEQVEIDSTLSVVNGKLCQTYTVNS